MMPLLRIVSDLIPSEDIVNRVKALGSILGYPDPRQILVEVSDGLTQADVAAVIVSVVQRDFDKPQFEDFCREVGQYLRAATHKSIQVMHPTACGVASIGWFPTEEGACVYGKGD